MILGLNLSFAVKRWLYPERLASMIRDDFQTSRVQFTFDLVDPWWPEEQRDVIAAQYRDAFAAKGVSIDSVFGGLASYSYPQLLAPMPEQRDLSRLFFRRAIDMTLALGSKVMGAPVGGMDYADARNPQCREERYQDMLESMRQIASYGAQKGLEEIHIEATPLTTEFPHSPAASVKLIQDLGETAIPVKLLIDWGHALYQPLLKEEADMDVWYRECGPYIGSIHLQQTDGQWDRHWDFTQEGIVTPENILETTRKAGLSDVPQYLEVVTAFEDDDDRVYANMKKTMDYLHKELGM